MYEVLWVYILDPAAKGKPASKLELWGSNLSNSRLYFSQLSAVRRELKEKHLLDEHWKVAVQRPRQRHHAAHLPLVLEVVLPRAVLLVCRVLQERDAGHEKEYWPTTGVESATEMTVMPRMGAWLVPGMSEDDYG